jgi:hypothetical protein
VIARTTVQHVVRDDYLNKNDIRREIERFDQLVDERLSDQNFIADGHDGFYIQDELTDKRRVLRQLTRWTMATCPSRLTRGRRY